MNRRQKEVLVGQLKDEFAQVPAAYVVGYSGLNVESMKSLRRQVRDAGGWIKVAKMRLVKRAVDGVPGADDLAPHLAGQCSVVFVRKDPLAVAKVLHTFSQGNERLTIVAGYYEKALVDKETIVALATLPPREVLIAQLLGLLNSPIVRLLGTLQAVPSSFVYALKQIEQKKANT